MSKSEQEELKAYLERVYFYSRDFVSRSDLLIAMRSELQWPFNRNGVVAFLAGYLWGEHVDTKIEPCPHCGKEFAINLKAAYLKYRPVLPDEPFRIVPIITTPLKLDDEERKGE